MADKITIPIVVTKDTAAIPQIGKELTTLEKQARITSKSVADLADSAGKTATKLARSAEVFGLPAQALRNLDDVMDVAEMGFGNLTKSAAGFNAASLGVAGAGFAVGTMLGGWLREIPAVAKAADNAAKALWKMFNPQMGEAEKGLKEFSARINKINEEAQRKQVAQLRSNGMSDKDISKFYGKSLDVDVAKEQGLTAKALEATARAQEEAKKRAHDILKFTGDTNKALVDVTKQTLDWSDVLANIDDQSEAILKTNQQLEKETLDAKKGLRLREGDMVLGDSGLWSRYQDVIDQELENAAVKTEAVKKETINWREELASVADLMQSMPGALGTIGTMLASVTAGISGMQSGLQTFQKGKSAGGFGGFLGQLSGVGGMAASAIGLGKSLWGGIKSLFGGKSEAQKQQEEADRKAFTQLTDSLKKQYGSLEALEKQAAKYGVSLKKAMDTKDAKALQAQLEELQKRTEGMKQAVEGIQKMVSGLTFTDASGQIQQTFSDPKVAGAVASSFGTTFWAAWRRLGVGAIEQLRGSWGSLLEELQTLGIDPVKMGLGRIGQLMDATNDPKTQALLQVTEGSAQSINGMLDAQIMSKSELENQTVVAQETYKELQLQGLDASLAAQAMQNDLAALARAYRETGQQMPEDLQAAMEAAGIDILPSQLDVLKEIRDLLKGGGGATHSNFGGGADQYNTPDYANPRGFGPRLLTSDTLFQAHAGERVMIVPKGKAFKFRSAARGYFDEDYSRNSAAERQAQREDAAAAGTVDASGSYVPVATSSSSSTVTTASVQSGIIAAVQAAVAQAVSQQPVAMPVSITNAPTLVLQDQSMVKTVEGQQAFGKYVVGEVEKALDQNTRGLGTRFEQIAERVARRVQG